MLSFEKKRDSPLVTRYWSGPKSAILAKILNISRIIYPFENNNLTTTGIDERSRLPTSKMKSNAWFSHSWANKMAFLTLFFAHVSVNFYVVTTYKSEETRARELSGPLQNCRWICLLKGVSPRPGRINIACFFSVQSGGTVSKIPNRGPYRNRCIWHPTNHD